MQACYFRTIDYYNFRIKHILNTFRTSRFYCFVYYIVNYVHEQTTYWFDVGMRSRNKKRATQSDNGNNNNNK